MAKPRRRVQHARPRASAKRLPVRSLLKMYMLRPTTECCIRNGLQHRRIRLIAVPELFERVAFAERLAGDDLDKPDEVREVGRLKRNRWNPCLGQLFPSRRQEVLAFGLCDAPGVLGALNAIDPQAGQ